MLKEWYRPKKLEDPELITQFEKQYGIVFPEDFKKCVLEYNGASPVPHCIFLTNGEKILNELVFDRLCNFNKGDKGGDIFKGMDNFIEMGLFPKIIPMGYTCFGDGVCFTRDFKVVFYNHELEVEDQEFYVIADSFSDLLTKFHESSGWQGNINGH